MKWTGLVKIKHKLYRCRFNYALWKLILDNGLDDLRSRENPDSSAFNRYSRSSGTRSKIDRVYTNKKIASNTKINYIMVSFIDHYNAVFIDRFPSKTKIGKDSWYFNNYLLRKPEFPSTSKTFLFLLETQKTTILQQVTGGKTLNLIFKKMLELFLKIFTFSRKQNFSTEKKTAKLIQKGKLQTIN